jgi:uncharacterized protein (TIGR02246 family)
VKVASRTCATSPRGGDADALSKTRQEVRQEARQEVRQDACREASEDACHDAAEVDRLFGEHVNAGDLDALVDLYEADATLGQLDGSAVRGRRAIREALNGLSAAQAKLEMNVVKVVEGGSDVAVLMNDWRMKAVAPDGKPVEMTGKALEVVRRQRNRTWRFVIDLPYARG